MFLSIPLKRAIIPLPRLTMGQVCTTIPTVLHDPYFLQAIRNTFILVVITVPLSTLLALLISVALSSVKALKKLFQTIYFLPYVTNTLAVGLVFMILFKKTAYSDGLINLVLKLFGQGPVDFIDGPYWAKMLVLCIYTIWIVMPFKVLILTSALASVNQNYYNAARVDGTSRFRIFIRITLPMISPTVFYLIITGFIGAFKAYSDAVALFGTDLKRSRWHEHHRRLCLRHVYGNGGGHSVLCPSSSDPVVCYCFDNHLHKPACKPKHVYHHNGEGSPSLSERYFRQKSSQIVTYILAESLFQTRSSTSFRK